MRRQAITVLVGLAVGVGLGLLVARSGAVADRGELTDLRLWLLGAAVLAAFASGPVTGALTGLAAMVGALGTLEVTPIAVGVDDPGLEAAIADLLDDTTWLDPLLLAGAAVAGAAVGAVRLLLRTGRRLVLILVAVAVLAAAVLGTPQLSQSPLAPADGVAGLR